MGHGLPILRFKWGRGKGGGVGVVPILNGHSILTIDLGTTNPG